jgi:hypothetical protein
MSRRCAGVRRTVHPPGVDDEPRLTVIIKQTRGQAAGFRSGAGTPDRRAGGSSVEGVLGPTPTSVRPRSRFVEGHRHEGLARRVRSVGQDDQDTGVTTSTPLLSSTGPGDRRATARGRRIAAGGSSIIVTDGATHSALPPTPRAQAWPTPVRGGSTLTLPPREGAQTRARGRHTGWGGPDGGRGRACRDRRVSALPEGVDQAPGRRARAAPQTRGREGGPGGGSNAPDGGITRPGSHPPPLGGCAGGPSQGAPAGVPPWSVKGSPRGASAVPLPTIRMPRHKVRVLRRAPDRDDPRSRLLGRTLGPSVSETSRSTRRVESATDSLPYAGQRPTSPRVSISTHNPAPFSADTQQVRVGKADHDRRSSSGPLSPCPFRGEGSRTTSAGSSIPHGRCLRTPFPLQDPKRLRTGLDPVPPGPCRGDGADTSTRVS